MAIAEPAPAPAEAGTRTAYRTCPLCEASCGLEITLRPADDGGEEVVRIRGDRDDVFSHGYICPKGSTLKQLHEDPDRLRRPLVKRDGRFVEVGWDEAFAEIEARLLPVIEPTAATRRRCTSATRTPTTSPACSTTGRSCGRSAPPTSSRRRTVDQRPKEISAALMFGGGLNVPVPDIDRTDHLLMLGANPYASNGSLATAPDWPGRLEAAHRARRQARRRRPAPLADRGGGHRAGADPARRRRLPAHGDGPGALRARTSSTSAGRAELVTGLDEVVDAAAPSRPRPCPATGSTPTTIRRLARELAAAPTACVYGRIGTTTAEFGTLTSWLVDVLNVLTGNLDRPGGAMFTKAAAGASNTRGKPRVGREVRLHRRTSRVRELPETFGELPAVVMAEEMDTPGRGRSAPWSRSPATRCCPPRTPPGSTPPWPTSTAWCRSTSTSTRPPATPT